MLCTDRGRVTAPVTATAKLQAGWAETAEAAIALGTGELGSAFTYTGKGGLTEDAAAVTTAASFPTFPLFATNYPFN